MRSFRLNAIHINYLQHCGTGLAGIQILDWIPDRTIRE
jgi:hypothetical protein